jgi:hypothetical protein
MYIITESPTIMAVPENIKKVRGRDFIRMECILQTANEINKNRRRYAKNILEDGLGLIQQRIKEGSFVGELDHPIDTRPIRQVSVLFKEVSHVIKDYGWDGDHLIGVVETLDTPNGNILKNLVLQGIPVGYSLRGMGEIRQISEAGMPYYDVYGNLKIITYDSVSNPSHSSARIRKLTESVQDELAEDFTETSSKFIHESDGICEKNGLICTKEGVCYLPNQFDKLVNQRVITLINKYKF